MKVNVSLCNKRKIAAKPTIHVKSALSKTLLRKFYKITDQKHCF